MDVIVQRLALIVATISHDHGSDHEHGSDPIESSLHARYSLAPEPQGFANLFQSDHSRIFCQIVVRSRPIIVIITGDHCHNRWGSLQ